MTAATMSSSGSSRPNGMPPPLLEPPLAVALTVTGAESPP